MLHITFRIPLDSRKNIQTNIETNIQTNIYKKIKCPRIVIILWVEVYYQWP